MVIEAMIVGCRAVARVWIFAYELILHGASKALRADGIQNSLCPILVIGVDNHNSKSVLVALHPHPFGIIDVQIDAEGRRVFGW